MTPRLLRGRVGRAVGAARLVGRSLGLSIGLAGLLAGAAPADAPLLVQAAGQMLAGACTGGDLRMEDNRNTVTSAGECRSLVLKSAGSTVQTARSVIRVAKPVQTALQAAGPLNLAGNDQQKVADCAGRDVTVTGARSAYELHGGCRALTVRGDLLTVRAEMQPGARIAVNGRGSVVSWRLRDHGPDPLAVAQGVGSRVQRAPPDE